MVLQADFEKFTNLSIPTYLRKNQSRVIAKVKHITSAAPASFSTRAASPKVAPVVSTSSTSKNRFPEISPCRIARYTPSTFARRAAASLRPDWAGLSTIFSNVSWGATCQSTHKLAARYLAWSKPLFFRRFLLFICVHKVIFRKNFSFFA